MCAPSSRRERVSALLTEADHPDQRPAAWQLTALPRTTAEVRNDRRDYGGWHAEHRNRFVHMYEYVAARTKELQKTIKGESLKPDETRHFIDTAFRNSGIQTIGTAITKVLPPVSRFAVAGGHGEKKPWVLSRLGEFFERFFGLSARGDAKG